MSQLVTAIIHRDHATHAPRLLARLALLVAALAAGAAGCVTTNPDYWCATDAECALAGLTEPTSCAAGMACVDTVCQAAEGCTTSADCADPLRATCDDGVCVGCSDVVACGPAAPVCDDAAAVCGACAGDADCAGFAASPACAPTGACVECTGPQHCGGTSPVCGDDQRCGACQTDGECGSGACEVTTGACVEPARIVYVDVAATSAGDGSAERPARNLTEAAELVTTSRGVIVLRPGRHEYQTSLGATAATELLIVGAGATLSHRGPGVGTQTLDIFAGVVTMRGVTIEAHNEGGGVLGNVAVRARLSARVRLEDVTVATSGGAASLKVDGASVTVSRSRLRATGWQVLTSPGSTLVLDRSVLDGGGASPGLRLSQTSFTIDNCVIAGHRGPVLIDRKALAQGSQAITHTTFVDNGQTVVDGGAHLQCAGFFSYDLPVVVRHDVFVSPRPYSYDFEAGGGLSTWGGTPCRPSDSLIDQPGHPTPPGAGMIFAPAGLVAPAVGAGFDPHLTATSPAIDAGVSSVATVDLDGDPRLPGRADYGADEFTP